MDHFNLLDKPKNKDYVDMFNVFTEVPPSSILEPLATIENSRVLPPPSPCRWRHIRENFRDPRPLLEIREYNPLPIYIGYWTLELNYSHRSMTILKDEMRK